MPTDTERREVARRLREYVDLPDDWWADTYSGFYVEKCAFGNVERHRESELFARLADLIEPQPERTCHPVDYHIDIDEGFIASTCSECGELLVNFDFEQDPPKPIGYCQGCGARVVEEES